MKKILAFLVVFVAALQMSAASDYTKVRMTFNRTGTTAASVAVSATDAKGQAWEGANAELIAVSHELKTGNACADGSVLCPSYGNSKGESISFTFRVTGLSGFKFDTAEATIWGLNYAGANQGSGVSRTWDISLQQGAASVSEFARLTGIDICATHDGSGNCFATHALKTTAGVQEAGNELILVLTLTRTADLGCFAGLSELTLYNSEEELTPENDLSESDTYYIRWNPTPTLYMCEEASGTLVVGAQDDALREFWKFIPTGEYNEYYIRNTVTGRYIQSCNRENSPQNIMQTGTEPRAYYIWKHSNGSYRLTSTDCPNYKDTSSTPHGLNKDGASSNVIVWAAGSGNSGSYWRIEATSRQYELKPFNSEATQTATPTYRYQIINTDGLALSMEDDGRLAWKPRTNDDDRLWYFVGQTNNTTGYQIWNIKYNTSVNAGAFYHFILNLNSAADFYSMRPFADKDDESALVSLDEVTEFRFIQARNDYSRHAQVYNMPCGALDNYITELSLTGEGALKPLTYPISTLSGKESTVPAKYYTIFVRDKGTVAAGGKVTLAVKTRSALVEGEALYAYFDWNRDGEFEDMYDVTSLAADITVPADAATGKSRMRLRLTGNGLSDAEDEVAGQILDCIVYISAPVEAFTLSAVPNDPQRGEVRISREGDDVHLQALTYGETGTAFLCWREGLNVLSTEAEYAFHLDHNTDIVAYFTPNLGEAVPTGIGQATAKNTLINISAQDRSIIVDTPDEVLSIAIFDTAGKLLRKGTGRTLSTEGIPEGAYIVRAVTASQNGTVKVVMRR